MTISLDDLLVHSFVVSIDDKRYSIFLNELSKIGFTADNVKRFDGFKMKFNGYNSEYHIPPINQGIIGVGFAHAAIVQIAKMFNYDYVCIFEDDAYPDPDIMEKLKAYLADIPDDADILKLGMLYHYKIDSSNFKLVNGKYYRGIKTYGSHAYIVFKKFYDKYMNLFEHDIICDHSPFNSSDDIYITKENLFIQYNQTSDIMGAIQRTCDHENKFGPIAC